MNNQQEIRTIFIEEFIKRMIVKSLPRTRAITEKDSMISKMEKTSKSLPVLKITTKFEETPPHLTKEFLIEENTKPAIQLTQKSTQISAKGLAPRVINISQPQSQITKPNISVMERLTPLFRDSTISTINCPAPGRNIIITRYGRTQQTKIILSREEIKSFLKEISEKTRIPLLPGIFKVIYQDLSLTAVVSDYIDTKFIIEKVFSPQIPMQGQRFQNQARNLNPYQPPRFQFR